MAFRFDRVPVAEATVVSNGGKLGEIFEDHGRFEIVLPAPYRTKVTATLLSPGTGKLNIDPPDPDPTKTRRAIRLAIDKLGLRGRLQALDVEVRINRSFEHGSGLGQSSNDMRCAVLAVLKALGVDISEHDLNQILASIEPTDPDVGCSLALWDHLRGLELSPRYRLPSCCVVGAIPIGSTLDTSTIVRPTYSRHWEWLFRVTRNELLTRILPNPNRVELARVATLSARINQDFFAKPAFWPLWQSLPPDAGIVVAHSGTVIAGIGGPDELLKIFDWITATLRSLGHAYEIIAYTIDGNSQSMTIGDTPFRRI